MDLMEGVSPPGVFNNLEVRLSLHFILIISISVKFTVAAERTQNSDLSATVQKRCAQRD